MSDSITDPVIELRDIRKRFRKTAVLEGVNLRVPAGKTYAFLGRNGAGKTTTIRMLMGLLKPDAGRVRVLGLDPEKDAMAIRRQVGYLAEDQQMWGWMKVREIIRFIAAFYPTWDMPYGETTSRKISIGVGDENQTSVERAECSAGAAACVAHRPKLMILDDPALGLDPIMRKDFLRDVVEHLQGQNITVFFSSHLLYEVEPVADIVGILDKGVIVREAGTEELRNTVKRLTYSRESWCAG